MCIQFVYFVKNFVNSMWNDHLKKGEPMVKILTRKNNIPDIINRLQLLLEIIWLYYLLLLIFLTKLQIFLKVQTKITKLWDKIRPVYFNVFTSIKCWSYTQKKNTFIQFLQKPSEDVNWKVVKNSLKSNLLEKKLFLNVLLLFNWNC